MRARLCCAIQVFAGRVENIIGSLNASFEAARDVLPDGLVKAFAELGLMQR
jgi:hypothetical protein